MAQSPHRRGAPVFGVLLVAFGVLLLLQTFGVVSWTIWSGLWRLWPVLLIIAGVGIIFGRRAPWLAGVLILALIVGAIGFASFNPDFFAGKTITTTLQEPLLGATSLNATLDFGAGNLKLGSLPKDSTNLLEGTFATNSDGINSSVKRNGDGVTVTLQRRQPRMVFGSVTEEWNVQLSQSVATDLTVNAGASDLALDLSDLNVTNLAVKAGASNAAVVLPGQAAHVSARFDVGAAHLDVQVPAGVAARIHSSAGVSSVNVDTARFPKTGEYYQSPDYGAAAHTIDLEVKSGVADVTVH